MKHIRILFLISVLASMYSCAVMNTTTTRTARSYVIETDIKQMPTVADLVVDSVYAKEDTTWTNSFKQNTSKSDMRKLLLGKMLEDNDADVIIQPRESSKTTTQGAEQTNYMQVYGYPARYRNFRTATEQDLRIINGLDPQPVNYNTIYLGTGFQKAPIASNMAKEIAAPVKPRKLKKPPYVRNPYIANIEVGYNFLGFFNFLEGGHGFLFNFNSLWRMKNPHIYEGIGVGLNAIFGKYDGDNDGREWLIPVYSHTRFYFAQRKCIPFFDFRIGTFVGIEEWNHNNNWANKELDIRGGLYYAAFLGMEFGRHVSVAFGSDQFFGGSVGQGIYFNLSLSAKLGISF